MPKKRRASSPNEKTSNTVEYYRVLVNDQPLICGMIAIITRISELLLASAIYISQLNRGVTLASANRSLKLARGLNC